ncbi:MAG: alanine racemase [Clostridiaceae bacterium BRH_c20a]|nr:MAG: alanine racemase [Clostridiaceae bacterium BRH_c20a]
MNSRPVWAEIDLEAIQHNLLEVRKLVRTKLIMAVVKANAYGHGALEVSHACLAQGADRLAVAILNEAVLLRQGGIQCPIMVLGWTPIEDYQRALENNVILTIYNLEEARMLDQQGAAMNKKATVHIKVDSGMTRIGLVPSVESLNIAQEILAMQNLEVEGIFTHLAKADELDKTYSHGQLKRFLEFVHLLEEKSNQQIPIKHVANSAAIIDLPEAYLDMVRPGIMLYGLKPSGEVNLSRVDLKPAMTLKARASRVERFPKGTRVSYGGIFTASQETVIASLPLGYADGYTRLLTGKGEVLYQNQRFPIIGRICMDQCMVDITSGPSVEPGDEFILLGKGQNANISVDEIAEKLGTINYEVVCMISDRVPRIYTRNKIP